MGRPPAMLQEPDRHVIAAQVLHGQMAGGSCSISVKTLS